MAKKNLDAVIVYWVERGSGSLMSQLLGPNDIFRGGTYESEVRMKYAVDPIAIEEIPIARAGEGWAVAAVERLRMLAKEQQVGSGP